MHGTDAAPPVPRRAARAGLGGYLLRPFLRSDCATLQYIYALPLALALVSRGMQRLYRLYSVHVRSSVTTGSGSGTAVQYR